MPGSSHPSIAIVGTGAIGGLLGFKFVQAGFPVTFFERGERLKALRTNGLTLLSPGGERQTLSSLAATDNFNTAGRHDIVFLAVKAHQIEALAHDVSHLLHPDSVLVTLQNGLPWWYFQDMGDKFSHQRLECLDPSGVIGRHIPAHHIVGCVAYPAARMDEPAVVTHVEGERFPVGELDGRESKRCQALVDHFQQAGLKSRVLTDIRSEIWLKAWGSLSFNPISALTRATMEEVCRFAPTRTLAAGMMREAQEVAEKLGVTFRTTIERRLEGAEAVGPHKTSMLQDVEAEQPMELQALIGSILELAQKTQTPVPLIETVHACVALLDKTVCGRELPSEVLT